jgi:pyruvate kinase
MPLLSLPLLPLLSLPPPPLRPLLLLLPPVLQVAKYRPEAPILVLTPSGVTARCCESLLRGTRCYVMGSMIGSEAILHRAADIGKGLGWCKTGDYIVGVHGVMEGVTGHTNLLKVLLVE